MTRPLAIDLCAGLGGWTEGLLLEGFDVIGFDIERHRYGSQQYPAQLVLQDILTLDGQQFRGRASLIVASPPCQRYSYMAMPWTRAKDLITWYRDPCHPERILELNALFDACVVMAVRRMKEADDSVKCGGSAGDDWFTHHNRPEFEDRATKNSGGSRFNVAHNTTSGTNNNPTRGDGTDGVKLKDDDGYEHNHPAAFGWKSPRTSSGNTSARKAASARLSLSHATSPALTTRAESFRLRRRNA